MSADTCLEIFLVRLRDALYARAPLSGFPAALPFDALPSRGAWCQIGAEPDDGTLVVDESGSFLCVEADTRVRLVCDADDPAAAAFPAARRAVRDALCDTAALVADNVAPVLIFRGESAAGVDGPRLVAEFRLRALVAAWWHKETVNQES